MDMNDSRPTGRYRPSLPRPGAQGPRTSPPVDPAYADQAPYAPTYGGHLPPWAPRANQTSPTRPLPAYWAQHDMPPAGESPTEVLAPLPPPQGPKSPRWLWIAAIAAVLLVVALVMALVLANDAIKTQTAVPPLPAMPEPTTTTAAPPPSVHRSPSRLPAPIPPTTGPPTPSGTTGPAGMQDVVYTVAGEGRAISVMYIDTGDLIQTEFNVALPWTKEVSLSRAAVHPANVTIVNIGHSVTCSVSIDGVQVSRRIGGGLTICDARG
nr:MULTISPECIES: MmpS family transport accessory protein [unclassified Mycobacterium]